MDDDTAVEKEALGAKVDPALKHEVRVAAAKADMTMSAWVREAINEKLARDVTD